MTRGELEKYRSIVKEIKQLEGYLSGTPPMISDTVKTGASFPYTVRPIGISGTDYALVQRWQNALQANRRKKNEIQKFIENVSDEQIRTILRYWCYEGISWQAIATRMGWANKDTPRKKVDLFLSNLLNSPKHAL